MYGLGDQENQLTIVNVKTVWIDSSFTQEEETKIVEAFQTLECSTNYTLVAFRFRKGARMSDFARMNSITSLVVLKTTSSDPRIILSDITIGAGLYTIGLALPDETIPTILLVEDRGSNAGLYSLALHEAIHLSLGIHKHTESFDAIMYGNSDKSTASELTQKDFELICKIHQCDPTSFKVCKGN